MGVNPWNPSSLLSVSLVLLANLSLAACFLASYVFFSSSEILLILLKLFHMVGACCTRLSVPSGLFSGHTSYTKLSSPLQSTMTFSFIHKCHFPSKTSTSLCLHALCSFSVKLRHLCQVILNMYLYFFRSYRLLFFLSIYLQLYSMLASWLLPI